MLEKYIENFDPGDVIRSVMEKRLVSRTAALSIIGKEVPREAYFQDKIKKGLKARYPAAYIVKISQAMYSEAGIPDILCVLDGHYFGFEVKRPILGKPTKLQMAAMTRIRKAGGTAAVVSWPEEAYKIIDTWRKAHEQSGTG